MNLIKNTAVTIVIATLLVLGGLKYTASKLAFVDNNRLILEYAGSKKAQKEIKVKLEQWQVNIDTLGIELEEKIALYQKEAPKLSADQKIEREKELNGMQQQFFQYRDAIQQKMTEEDLKVTTEVVQEINEFVNNYAKKNGYLFIFGASGNGNIVFADPKFDLTDEILENLNTPKL
jgi:outer membrane protein